jgi:hypothetical protein
VAGILVLSAELESVRAVPPGIERGRHVPDYRYLAQLNAMQRVFAALAAGG